MPRKQTESRANVSDDWRHGIYHACGGICAHCGRHMNFKHNFTIEHVIPLRKGGSNRVQNLVGLCRDCNKDKSDDVVRPMDYYPYLPEKMKKTVQALFDEYIDSVDWMAHDNLFRLDQFDISVRMPVIMGGGRKIGFMPASMRVAKLRKEKAINWFFQYAARLDVEDKHVVPLSENELNTSWYEITYLGKSVMAMTAFIQDMAYGHAGETYGKPMKSIVMQIFVSHELQYKEQMTGLMLFGVLQSILSEIQHTLERSKTAIFLRGHATSPRSDTYAAELYSTCVRHAPENFIPSSYGNNGRAEDSVTGVTFIMCAGSHAEKAAVRERLKEINQAPDAQSAIQMLDSLALEFEHATEQRLAGSKPIQSEQKTKKKDKKRGRKH